MRPAPISTRLIPTTVANHATAGATRICGAVTDVLSHAASSTLSDNAPRMSGNPIEKMRLWKFAMNDPIRTAATANNGRWDRLLLAVGLLSFTSFISRCFHLLAFERPNGILDM